VQVVNTMRLCH